MSISTVTCSANGYKVNTKANTCPTCSTGYNTTVNKPLSLGCQHCVCQHCAGTMSKKSNKVTCGTCKKTTKLGKDTLPVNEKLLAQIISAFSTQESSQAVPNVPVVADVPVVLNAPVPDAITVTNVPAATNVSAVPDVKAVQDAQTAADVSNVTHIAVNTAHIAFVPSVEEKKNEEETKNKSSVTIIRNQSAKIGPIQPTSVNISNKRQSAGSPKPTGALRLPDSQTMCCKCSKNPAEVTIINSKLMKTEKICRSCARGAESQVKAASIPAKVVVVEADVKPDEAVPAEVVPDKVEAEAHKESLETPAVSINIKSSPQPEEIIVESSEIKAAEVEASKITELDEATHVEGNTASEEKDVKPVVIEEKSKPATIRRKEEIKAVNEVTQPCPCDGPPTESENTSFSAFAEVDVIPVQTLIAPERQTAFNPNYNANNLPEPEVVVTDEDLKELEAPSYMNTTFQSKAEEILHQRRPATGQRVTLRQPPIVNTNECLPPRYEDVLLEEAAEKRVEAAGLRPTPASLSKKTAQKTSASVSPSPSTKPNSSSPTQLLLSFGKYGEQSTRPGAFSEPNCVKISSGQGYVVVTDMKNENVQTFNLSGECLSLIKVAGITSCAMSEPDKLIVGTKTGLQFFDLNGNKNSDLAMGPVVNVTCRNPDYFVVVQRGSFSVFSAANTLIKKVESAWLPDNEKQEFVNLVDVALTLKEDFVVLDAGANDGTGSIYVLGANGSRLKSAIHPKREPCGALLRPTSVSVDRHNRIIVADAGNKRVLAFKSGKEPVISQVLGPDSWPPGSGRWPAGLDCSNGKIYVAQRADRYAEIAVYSYV